MGTVAFHILVDMRGSVVNKDTARENGLCVGNGQQAKVVWECDLPAVPATWGAEAGGLQVQSLLKLQSEFRSSLGSLMRHCVKIQSKKACGAGLASHV